MEIVIVPEILTEQDLRRIFRKLGRLTLIE